MKFLGVALVIVTWLVTVVCPFTLVQADDGADNVTDNASIAITITVLPPAPVYAEPSIIILGTPGLNAVPALRVDSSGIVQADCLLSTLDQRVSLKIAKGTKLLDAGGKALGSLSAEVVIAPAAPPTGTRILGLTYDLVPDGATFDPPITLTITYDPSLIPGGVAEENLVIAYYDEDAGRWIELDSVVDTLANIVSAKVSHFSKYATFVRAVVAPPVVAPAAFTVSHLTISPSEVYIGETVTISVIVTNVGGESGSYDVTLKINGVVEVTKEVTVNVGFGKEVTFSTTRDIAGSYLVDVDGLTSSLTVKEKPVIPEIPPVIPKPVNWWLIGGIIAGVIVVGLLVYFLVIRRRAT